MTNRKKRPLTLVELLIVIGVISVALSWTGIGIRKGLHVEQFSSSLSRLHAKLRLVQEIAGAYNTDLTITLMQQNKGAILLCDAPAHLAPHLQKMVTKPVKLKGIDSFSFNDEPKETLTLTWTPLEGVYPKGKLELKGIKKKMLYFPYSKIVSTKERNHASPYPKEVEKAPVSTA